MNQKKIKDTAKKHAPKSHYVKNEVIAFLSGGALAIAAQFVMMAYQTLLGVDEKDVYKRQVLHYRYVYHFWLRYRMANNWQQLERCKS